MSVVIFLSFRILNLIIADVHFLTLRYESFHCRAIEIKLLVIIVWYLTQNCDLIGKVTRFTSFCEIHKSVKLVKRLSLSFSLLQFVVYNYCH